MRRSQRRHLRHQLLLQSNRALNIGQRKRVGYLTQSTVCVLLAVCHGVRSQILFVQHCYYQTRRRNGPLLATENQDFYQTLRGLALLYVLSQTQARFIRPIFLGTESCVFSQRSAHHIWPRKIVCSLYMGNVWNMCWMLNRRRVVPLLQVDKTPNGHLAYKRYHGVMKTEHDTFSRTRRPFHSCIHASTLRVGSSDRHAPRVKKKTTLATVTLRRRKMLCHEGLNLSQRKECSSTRQPKAIIRSHISHAVSGRV